MGPQFAFRTITGNNIVQPTARPVPEQQEGEVGVDEEDTSSTAVLSPSHDLSDLLEICEPSTQTSPLSTGVEREGVTESPTIDSGEIWSQLWHIMGWFDLV